MQKFTGSGGVHLAYLDEPGEEGAVRDGQLPILLIHGFASTHAINWVFPLWVKTLTADGRRVILLDNRGHGRSEKLYDPASYHISLMAADALALLDHLGLERVDVMGYSMGARIGAFLAEAHPKRVRSLILGGLGHHLADGGTLPVGIADAMEAPSVDDLTDPTQRMFRNFADATKSDRRALAACIRGARDILPEDKIGRMRLPVLIAVGTKDEVAGNPDRLAAMFPAARVLPIPGRDHNRAVGDPVYKTGVLDFLRILE
jgi:pimeloyl-ACP methyl ester carboxylesterase